uniref:PARP catalytic domain-containing protein n=1 Tax=Leptobrachium leishanense TaxID=445787 RepID=A0A8C5MZD9_9ANUR
IAYFFIPGTMAFSFYQNLQAEMWRRRLFPTSKTHFLSVILSQRMEKIYVMYHGTTQPAAQEIIKKGFRPSADGMLGRGVYVSRDEKKAARYPLGDQRDQVILKLRVNVGKVKKIDQQDHPMQKTWHDHGYDTAWVPEFCGMVESGLEEDCVWDPKRIKVMDIWEEESFPDFREIMLPSDYQPMDGNIYVMYHGTTVGAAIQIIMKGFNRSADGMLGRGVYVSRDQDKAALYPLCDQSDQVLLKLRVNVGKVIKIDYQGHPVQKTWHDGGYDMAWGPAYCGMDSELEEDCVWDPNRIKVVGVEKAPHDYLGYLQQLDLWKEETFVGFCEIFLLSNARPMDGKLYTMYHGTTLARAEKIIDEGFKQSIDGILGRGVYVSRDIKKASQYPRGDKSDQVILKVRVNVGKVKRINRQGHPMQMTWHDNGFDTAWIPPGCGMVDSRLEEDCVWDPKRIKVLGFREVSLSSNEQPDDGKIYVMYHGTTLAAAKKKIMKGFKRSMNGILGRGIYVTRNVNEAANYPVGNTHNQVILKLRVNVGRVRLVDHRGDPLQRIWQMDYDSAYVPEYCGIVKTGIERDCIWDPDRIKVVGIVDAPQNYLHYLKNLVKRYK